MGSDRITPRESLRITGLVCYSVGHFVVDFVCAFILFRGATLGYIPDNAIRFCILLYNVLAFGLEVVVGPAFNAKTARLASAFGLALVMLATATASYAERTFVDVSTIILSSSHLTRFSCAVLTVSLAGIGNAFFHVGGGVDSLANNIGKYWRSGVFISTGSIGLALGMSLGGVRDYELSSRLVILALLICLCAIWFFARESKSTSALGESKENASRNVVGSASAFDDETVASYVARYGSIAQIGVVVASLFVIFTRSAVGFLAPTLWTSKYASPVDGLTLASVVFWGKFLGGFFADRLGPRKVGVAALALSIPTLCFAESWFLFLIGVFLLNITTSITLVATAQGTRGRVGFAFGLTTVALLLGYFLYDFVAPTVDYNQKSASVATAVFLALAAIGVFFIAPSKQDRQPSASESKETR